jgi:hypothetical protein
MILLIMIWAIWGAAMDWRYIRQGGVKPSRNDKLYVMFAIGLCAALMIFAGFYLNASAEAEAHVAELFLVLIFGLWEFGRWRTRLKNPLPKA